MRKTMPILLSMVACHGGDDSGAAWVAPGCGDGVLDVGEQCDDGASNSDSAPDGCRSNCRSASCGDGVIDSGEACDDGGPWGGDGCTPACEVEQGQLESEPNDTWDAAESLTADTVHGALADGDVDCFAVDLPGCGALGARLTGACPAPATLSLHDPDGVLVAVGAPDAEGCADLDPADAPGARFVAEGTWALCVEGLLGGEVPFYALEVDVVEAEQASYPLDEEDDPDGDGRPDSCDDDRDGDGVLDVDDNCPDVSNGPDSGPLSPSADGFIRGWLAAGPFTGTSSTESCRPSENDLVAEDDALAEPALGDAAGELSWRVLWSAEDRVDYLDFATVDAPREVYTAVYVHSESERSATLAVGPDDGLRGWLGGEEVLDISGCQGTTADQFAADVTLTTDWQLLLLKVRDQGGGWGAYVRFLDSDGEAITDLDLSLSADGAALDSQSDLDGDGIGDACDDDPVGG